MARDTTTQTFSSETPDDRDTFLYRRAMVLATECFQIARQLPEHERSVLFAEILQASVAIPANIAGAQQVESRRQRLHHFDVARGKLKRLQTLLIMAVHVDCVERAATTRVRVLANEIDGWLRTLIKQLARRH